MSFELQIAVRRDPADEFPASSTRSGYGQNGASKPVVFEVSGDFSCDGSASLARAVDDALTSKHPTYMVRLENISQLDADALLMFLQWARGRRAEGANVLVCAMQLEIHRAIEATGEADAILIPFERREDQTPRLVIDVDADRGLEAGKNPAPG